MKYSDQILVVCDSGSPKHGRKHPTPAVQGFFYRGDNFKDQLGQGWTDSNRSKRLRENKAHETAAQALVGDEKFSRKKHRGERHRESWTLRCLKCGYSVSIVHEKLYPALTRMREMGIDRIGLQDMAEGLDNTGA